MQAIIVLLISIVRPRYSAYEKKNKKIKKRENQIDAYTSRFFSSGRIAKTDQDD
jgi:hypothetical protein